MRRIAVCLMMIGMLAACLATSAYAGWVWRDGRWIYIDTSEPPLPPPIETPTPPTMPSETPKVQPPAPKVDVPAPPKADVPPPPSRIGMPAVAPPAPAPTPAPAAPRAAPAAEFAPPRIAAAGQSAEATSIAPNPFWRKPADLHADRTLFEQGSAAYAAGSYGAAARAFGSVIDNFPASAYREEAMWLRAGALMESKELYRAFTQYEELMATYAGSIHYHEALAREIEIGDRFLGGEHRRMWGIPLLVSAESEGLEILRRVYEHQPAGDLADGVVMKIADYHWSKREWQEAEDYYDKYCREYPNGREAVRAELQRAKCAIERCRGPRYDTTCLQLAIDRLRQFQQKFPDVAQREGVPDLLASVRDKQAQSLYEIAARYHRGGQPLAAAFYAEKLRAKYPDSPWSAGAGRLLGVAPAPEPAMEEPRK